VCTCVHACTYARTYAHTHAHARAHAHERMHARTHARAHTRMHTRKATQQSSPTPTPAHAALHMASANGHLDVVRRLLSAGAVSGVERGGGGPALVVYVCVSQSLLHGGWADDAPMYYPN